MQRIARQLLHLLRLPRDEDEAVKPSARGNYCCLSLHSGAERCWSGSLQVKQKEVEALEKRVAHLETVNTERHEKIIDYETKLEEQTQQTKVRRWRRTGLKTKSCYLSPRPSSLCRRRSIVDQRLTAVIFSVERAFLPDMSRRPASLGFSAGLPDQSPPRLHTMIVLLGVLIGVTSIRKT